jgi:glycine/sarcosine N-methyltransferase
VYDAFSSDYDRFVDWPSRLAAEVPTIERLLAGVQARRVLDVSCGTGMHALALARRGYEVVGADASNGMIERAKANVGSEDPPVRFEVAGFGELVQRVGGGFDALLCLGNSLPHVLTQDGLMSTLADFAGCLRPSGLVLIQDRNFDAVLKRRQRWMEPQTHKDGLAEWVFLRFYDFEPDGTLMFNLVTLSRDEGDVQWQQRETAARLRPLRRRELIEALEQQGFEEVVCWGDMNGSRFDGDTSPNLVVQAQRAS